MNNKEQLEKETKKKLEIVYSIDGHEITLTPNIVKKFIIGNPNIDVSDQEFMMFGELCRARKLNPFLHEAYCIKYSNNSPATIVVGKDAILKRAVLHPQYNGMKSGVYVIGPNGDLIKRNGSFKLPDEILVGGWAEVFRKNWDYSIEASASFDEAVQTKKDGTVNSSWSKQPAVMIEKVAKVRAVREAFIEDLGGIYDESEMSIDLDDEDKIIPQEDVEEAVIKEEQSEYEQVDINNL